VGATGEGGGSQKKPRDTTLKLKKGKTTTKRVGEKKGGRVHFRGKTRKHKTRSPEGSCWEIKKPNESGNPANSEARFIKSAPPGQMGKQMESEQGRRGRDVLWDPEVEKTRNQKIQDFGGDFP